MTPQDFAPWAGACALRATLHEAAAIGKPGLVCADTSGAHSDMDISTLFHSAVTLGPYFTMAAALGIQRAHETGSAIFSALRPLGKEAEENMLLATGRVNTHKGLVFSLGLACAAAGQRHGQGLALTPEAVCAAASDMVQGITSRDFAHLLQGEAPRTAGEHFFTATGDAGIRGEAEAGFPHVLEALAVLRRAAPEKNFNQACLEALLALMSTVADTNIWHRGGQEGLTLVRREATLTLRAGLRTSEGQQRLARLCQCCLERRLSPGGSADLLAMTLFLYFIRKQPV